MSSAVEFERVSKRFRLRYERPRSFQEALIRRIGSLRRNHPSPHNDLWVLRDVNLTIPAGESLAIIGANGAGKSTLLKLVSRILEPTTGQVRIHGRVAGLLEIGTGFHPDLSGRENVYLYGSLLGLKQREIAGRFDAIVEFSGVGPYLDVPVRHYSSGMYMRLGFAVATSVDAEVLLIDEVLAVGDQVFQAQCLARIRELQRQGVTILFVSHDLNTVRQFCTSALWLENGEVQAAGGVDDVVGSYLGQTWRSTVPYKDGKGAAHGAARRWGSGEAQIVDVRFCDAQGREPGVFYTGESLTARILYRASTRIERPSFGIAIYRADGTHVTGPNTTTAGYLIPSIEGEGVIEFTIPNLPLLAGTYEFSATIYDYYSRHPYDHQHRMYTFRVQQTRLKEREGTVYIPSSWRHQVGEPV
jgi:ABC-type polysaccharide/polyol phosphate transport system ATPase subunit